MARINKSPNLDADIDQLEYMVRDIQPLGDSQRLNDARVNASSPGGGEDGRVNATEVMKAEELENIALPRVDSSNEAEERSTLYFLRQP